MGIVCNPSLRVGGEGSVGWLYTRKRKLKKINKKWRTVEYRAEGCWRTGDLDASFRLPCQEQGGYGRSSLWWGNGLGDSKRTFCSTILLSTLQLYWLYLKLILLQLCKHLNKTWLILINNTEIMGVILTSSLMIKASVHDKTGMNL